MEQEKDYSLLRPFDLEAAKAGALCCWHSDGQLMKYIGPCFAATYSGCFEFLEGDEKGCFETYEASLIRRAPLAWVEGRPVYPGDVLWYKFAKTDDWSKVVARDRADEVNWMTCKDNIHRDIACMTWTPPKVKREGWTLVQKTLVYQLKSEVEQVLGGLRTPEHWAIVHIEFEE